MPKISLPASPPRHKVQIQLIPETSWYYNLRKVLPKEEWDKLRKQVYAYYQYQCSGCGQGNVQLHAHEVWKFDMRSKTQKLVRLVALCELCHAVEHIGHTELQSPKYVHKVGLHIKTVLGWTPQQFMKKREAAFNKWHQRNRYTWKVDFGPYTHLVRKELR